MRLTIHIYAAGPPAGASGSLAASVTVRVPGTDRDPGDLRDLFAALAEHYQAPAYRWHVTSPIRTGSAQPGDRDRVWRPAPAGARA